MQESSNTNQELYEEISALKQRISELEQLESEHKHAEDALHESEARAKGMLQAIPDMMFRMNSQGVFLDYKADITDLYSQSEPILIGKRNRDITPPEFADLIDRQIHTALKTGKLHTFEYQLTIPGRGLRDYEARMVATGEDEVTAIVRDVTDRIRSEKELKKGEERLRLITDNMSDMIRVTDIKGVNLFVSPSHVKGLGYKLEEREGKSVFEIVHPDDQEKVIKAFSEGLAAKRRTTAEYRVRHANGQYVWLDTVGDVLLNAQGDITAIVMSSRDVTQRRQAEEEIQKANTLLNSIVENIPNMIFLKEAGELRFARFNRAGEDLLGYSRNDLLGKNDYDFFTKEQADFFTENDREVLEGNMVVDIPEEPIQTLNKGERILHTKKVPILDTKGEPAYLLGISEDITDRKRAEEALYRAEREKSAILDAMSELIIYLDKDLRIIWANNAMSRQFNMKPNQLEGRHCYKVMHNLDQHCKTCPAVKAIATGNPCTIDDFSSYGKRWTLRAYPILNKEDEIIGVVEVVTDITERKRAEEERKESQRALSDIIEFLPDATLIIDKSGKVIAWNRMIEVMTGIKKEDMLGKGNYEYAIPFYGDRRPILIDLALHPDKEKEKRYTAIQRVGDILFGESFTPNLPPGDIHLSATASVLRDNKGEVTAAIECIRDNTERKRLEERLNRAEKMEGLGRLAGGVAHDLNNVLGVLVGYSELLRDKMPENSPLKRYADNIFQSGMRGAAIIQDLLTLARRGVNVSEVVDLNRLTYDYLRTPEFENLKSHHPGIKIWTELEEGLLNIKGSPVHLSKTLMNLITNAAEAVSGRGEVTIRTENRYLDRPIKGYDEMEEGDYVVLTVSDTGSGISANDLGRIFEPFYTKKVMGKSGTGLGLAVVWGTVKDHNGYIDVRSEEGLGSTFTIYFPVTREAPAKVEKAVSPVAYTGKGESILIVDDVKEQRELAMSMLGSLGYQIEAVASGEEAIEYLKEKKADLIVLDMIMEPGIDGMETYRKIIEMNHEQKAIIVSGFSETNRVKKAQEIGAGAFVRKPYILEKIGLAVRGELDRR